MSDEIAYRIVNIPNSKKRQRKDEFEETHISHLTLSSETSNVHVFDESLTRIEINQQTGKYMMDKAFCFVLDFVLLLIEYCKHIISKVM